MDINGDIPNKTPTEDLRKSDLEHYEEASTAAHHWSSGIPRAINYYYDMHSDKPLDRTDIESLGWEYVQESVDGINLMRYKLGKYKIKQINKIEFCIGIIAIDRFDVLFQGTIKNKSELKTLLKQLGV